MTPLLFYFYLTKSTLFSFTDFEHFGAARWTSSGGGWFAILHCNLLGILHLLLFAAFDTITFCHLASFRQFFSTG